MADMDWYQTVAFWAAVVVIALGFLAAFAVWIANFRSDWQIQILREHYAAIVGLPAAAAGAFVMVTLFRQVSGKIIITLPGLKLEEASGPIILWVVCFIAMALAIKMIWPLKS
ncbi:hypothetical protein [Bradyrhizobium sp. PRIMUS42]|uniref:hypothetical protein n=1 Tax=Bradyrhizobium sp. PRIMUS42 TaxID=2908926 RepID=UPI001FF5FF62|nr:hypothetical protein [Bradyrhizobium sp. PRIMUS42]MCJ9728947.1 hypothetical protein [Bradyrhizobium sp. PRIMUS42]